MLLFSCLRGEKKDKWLTGKTKEESTGSMRCLKKKSRWGHQFHLLYSNGILSWIVYNALSAAVTGREEGIIQASRTTIASGPISQHTPKFQCGLFYL